MTVYRKVRVFEDHFDRAQALTTTPGENGWTIADTSSSGTPTYLCTTEDGGSMKLTLVSTSELENICMFHNDVLSLDLAQLQNFWFVAKVAAVDALTVITMGLGNARNDDEDAVAVSAWFKMEGATSTTLVVAETDDGTTDNNDKATGVTLAATYKKFLIDFTNGLADVRFYINGERVASNTTFSMASITAGQNVQPIFQVEKPSGAGVPALQLAAVGWQHATAVGA